MPISRMTWEMMRAGAVARHWWIWVVLEGANPVDGMRHVRTISAIYDRGGV